MHIVLLAIVLNANPDLFHPMEYFQTQEKCETLKKQVLAKIESDRTETDPSVHLACVVMEAYNENSLKSKEMD